MKDHETQEIVVPVNMFYMCDTGNLKEILPFVKFPISNGGLELDVQGEIIKGTLKSSLAHFIPAKPYFP